MLTHTSSLPQLLIDDSVMKRQGEEGQFVDLAVTHGCNKVLELLLSLRFRVGGNALAYAARFHNIDAIQVRYQAEKCCQPQASEAVLHSICFSNQTVVADKTRHPDVECVLQAAQHQCGDAPVVHASVLAVLHRLPSLPDVSCCLCDAQTTAPPRFTVAARQRRPGA